MFVLSVIRIDEVFSYLEFEIDRAFSLKDSL